MTAGIDPQRWGVAPGFHDVTGQWRQALPETVDAILESMGATAEGPPPPAAVTIRTDHPMPPLGPGRLLLDDGATVEVAGALPADIPVGYHEFEPVNSPRYPLIVSPGKVPYPDRSEWGFAAQLYATRSERSWGIGDLADLRELCRWSATLQAGFALVNPLHAPTPSAPVQPSPYYPGSRCFMNPLYIAVEEVDGADRLSGLDKFVAAGRALNSERRIDRDRVWDLKSQALEAIFAEFAGAPDFERFCTERGRPLEMFAAFCALSEHHGTVWREWPAELRHPDGPAVERLVRDGGVAARIRFYSWLQWLLDRQAAAADERLGLVGDLAVGVDPSGPDSWIWQDCFAQNTRVGAPPDEFNTLGQDWGLPPFDPWRLRSRGYAPWIEALRSGMSHGSGLRVDHVMGLFRLYWIPAGSDARNGAYVHYPHDDMLNILALEAHRAGAYVIGEDLGTVEDEVRRDLAERRVLSYRVWWFEDGHPSSWPEQAMGAVTTHDLPTVSGVLSGSDLEAQRRIGMEPNEEASLGLQRKLYERAGAGPESPVEEVISGVYEDLGAAPCRLLVASLEDVLAVEERPNMPGTTDAWPNWSIALPAPLEDLENVPLAERVAERLRRQRST